MAGWKLAKKDLIQSSPPLFRGRLKRMLSNKERGFKGGAKVLGGIESSDEEDVFEPDTNMLGVMRAAIKKKSLIRCRPQAYHLFGKLSPCEFLADCKVIVPCT